MTDKGLHDASANDDEVDVFSAADLMGIQLWALYCERWQPDRFVAPPRSAPPDRKAAAS